jgi:hypothetical protein
MRSCALDHRWAKRAKEPVRLLVVVLVATIGFAPIASSRHELTVRHVVCAEHGELTHVRTTAAATTAATQKTASIVKEDGDVADSHEHCTNGFLVRGRLHVSVVRTAIRYTPPPAVTREVREIAVNPGRAFVLASAPKTSPPSA